MCISTGNFDSIFFLGLRPFFNLEIWRKWKILLKQLVSTTPLKRLNRIPWNFVVMKDIMCRYAFLQEMLIWSFWGAIYIPCFVRLPVPKAWNCHSLYTAFSSNVGAWGMWACSLFLSLVLHLKKLKSLSPKDACAKFGWNWPSASGEDFLISSMYFRYFVINSPWKRAKHFIWTILNPCHLPVRLLCAKFDWNWPSGSGEEDFLISSMFFSLFRNYLPLEKGGALYLNKLESPSPKDALCQVWLK